MKSKSSLVILFCLGLLVPLAGLTIVQGQMPPGQSSCLMGHESVETTRSFYAVFEQEDLRRKHDHFSAARWKESIP